MSIEYSDSFGNYLIHGIDEIVLADPVSWWPVTPGWQLLGLLVMLGLLLKLKNRLLSWWRNRYRRVALRQLTALQKQSDMQLEPVLQQLPFYLKATALHAYPREQVASLSGEDWLAFLDSHYSGPAFQNATGRLLTRVAYLPSEQWQFDTQQAQQLVRQSRLWIATHV